MEEKNKDVLLISLDDILPNRFQPRLTFDDKELQDLANSIKRYGVIQPIVLRKLGDKYEIIAGERRYKASTMAGLTKVPAIIMETDDNTSAEIALLENLQRKNLTPIEEAQSYKKLMDKGFTQDEIASKLGVSQSSIANKIRLLNLSKEVQDALLYGKISERHARCLLTLTDSDIQKNLLGRIINERLTVRQTEEEISLLKDNNDQNEEPLAVNLHNFLNPEPSISFPNQETVKSEIPKEIETPKGEILETLDFKIPDIIDISQEKENYNINETLNDGIKEIIVEKNELNPFQDNELPNIFDRIDKTRNSLNTYELKNDYNDPELKVENELSLPIMIDKVRNIANELGREKVSIEEIDLNDTYQIIINIKKD